MDETRSSRMSPVSFSVPPGGLVAAEPGLGGFGRHTQELTLYLHRPESECLLQLCALGLRFITQAGSV